MNYQIEQIIASRQRLREIISEPGRFTRHKAIDDIDDICRRFIIERDGKSRMY